MKHSDVVIFGAGGLAREVAWVLEMPGARLQFHEGQTLSDIRLVGHLDDRHEIHETKINGRPVLGGIEWLEDRPNHPVVVAIGNPSIRKDIVARMRRVQPRFPAVLPPHFIAGDHGSIGEGVIVLPGALVTVNVDIGNFVLLNPNVSVSHDGKIGDYTSLGPGVSLAGNVKVGSGCDIGTGATAIPGTRIGDNAIVGASACVTHDLPDNVTAVGVPARVIRTS